MNLALQEYPADSLETLILSSSRSYLRKKYELLEKYLLIKGIDEFIRLIFDLEIGITRKSFLNWLANKDCNYEQWMPLVNHFLDHGGHTETFHSSFLKLNFRPTQKHCDVFQRLAMH